MNITFRYMAVWVKLWQCTLFQITFHEFNYRMFTADCPVMLQTQTTQLWPMTMTSYWAGLRLKSPIYWVFNSTVCSGADQRRHQCSASLAFVRGNHRVPLNSPHKGPVTRKMVPFDDVIMPPMNSPAAEADTYHRNDTHSMKMISAKI